MRDFLKLNVWQKAHQLTVSVYNETAGFPRSESFGLRAQLRGAAVSIETNIAEGSGRRTGRDFGRFVDIALGSVNETECELRIAHDLGWLDADSASRLMDQTIEVRRMLLRLRSTLS
jgi:four helix bundle protein